VLLASFSVIPFFQDGNTASMLALIFQNLKRLPAMLIAAYTFNDYLLPQYYAQKKYLVFAVLTVLLFYVTSALDRVVNVYVYEPLFREPPFVQESIKQIFSDIPFLIGTYLTPVLIASITMTFERVIRQKQAAENRNIELERDKNRAELNALKSQLHPHFLFNTLNNLYALTVQKSDKAPETVATLSEMLDYILYQCNDRLVPLQKEVDLLENYITLERLRYGDDIAITSEYAFAKAGTQIAPLLLLSIVENAFKHGASGSITTPEIHINIRQEGDQLFVEVKNTKSPSQQQDPTGYSKGIGVSNVQRQLALLYSDFSYEVTDENGWFAVALRLNTTAIND
jgi:LytS/YehU family sensor histidine kinase